MYRPENMSVIITGALQNRDHILEMLSDHELDFYDSVYVLSNIFIISPLNLSFLSLARFDFFR